MPTCRPAPTSARSAATVSSGPPRTSITSIRRPAGRSFEGPLRPRAFDAKAAAEAPTSRSRACCCSPTPICQHRDLDAAGGDAASACATPTATCCCSSTQGEGDLFCDFGHLTYRDGDYILLPRGTMWRLEPTSPTASLLIEATNGAFKLPERGILGPHALFDPAALDTPKLDDAFQRAARRRMAGAGQAPRRDLHHHLSLQSAGCGGLEGQSRAGEAQLARHPPGDEPPLSHSAQRAFDLRGRPLRRLHLRAAADRERSRRAESAVLPFQRRFRRSDLLSRRRVLQPRQHPSRHGDLASQRLHPWPASQGLRGRRQGGQDHDRRSRGDDRRARSAGHERQRRRRTEDRGYADSWKPK